MIVALRESWVGEVEGRLVACSLFLLFWFIGFELLVFQSQSQLPESVLRPF